MKARPYSKEQVQEFEAMTARLSPAARGIWFSIRMQMCKLSSYILDGPPEELGWVLRCPSDALLTSFKEFELKKECGFRLEKPPPKPLMNGHCTDYVRLVYEPDEKAALLSSSESLRLKKYREDKNKKEKIKIPENWELSEKNLDFARANGMTPETVRHEFEKCRTHHAEAYWTQKGWDELVWRRWVLNWVSYGRKQIQADVWAQ